MIKNILLFCFNLMLLASCQVSKGPDNNTAQVESIPDSLQIYRPFDSSALVYTNANDDYRPEETKIFDLIHTKLEVKFDWDKQHLLGKATPPA